MVRNTTRRTVLKGGAGIASMAGLGFGVSALAGSAAAMSSSLTAVNPGVVQTDDGDIEEVFVTPRVYTRWENFDEVPLKLRYILEAGIEGAGFKPVYRETPWLFSDSTSEQTAYDTAEVGTTDRVPASGRNYLLTANSDFYSLDANGNPQNTPKIVLYKDGLSAYYDEASDYPDNDHFTGASLGADSGDYANGNYGVLGDTSALDSGTDGESQSTTIHLRLTTALLNYQSESVMQDEYPVYSGSAGYTYQRLRDIAPNHPGVGVSQTTFVVEVQNEQATAETQANANVGVN